MIIATVLCPLVLKKISKKKLMIYSSFFSAVVYTAMYFIPLTEFNIIVGVIFLTGFSLGIFMVLRMSLFKRPWIYLL